MAQVTSSPIPYKTYPAFAPHQMPAQTSNRSLGFGAFGSHNSTPASALAFGFGQSGVASSSGAAAGWRTPSVQSPNPFNNSSPSAYTQQAGPSTSANPQSSNRRKRRSSSSPEPDQQAADDDSFMLDAQSPVRAKAGQSRAISINKRAKRAEVEKGNDKPGQAESPVKQIEDGVDIGKMLAGLSKPALIQMITALLTTQPQLRPILLALIPPPSLESFTETITALESKVINAIPQGRQVRQEYVWGRTRVPLEEYLAEARHALAVFLPSSSSMPTHNEEHPSTIFTFLHTLTASVKKVESLLPVSTSTTNISMLNASNPLVAHLVPNLINAWHVFITKLSAQVNKQGKMMSADSVRTRFRLLDELCASTPGAGDGGVVRKAMEDVRERMAKEIGWLAGILPAAQKQQVQQQQSSRAQSVEMMDEEL